VERREDTVTDAWLGLDETQWAAVLSAATVTAVVLGATAGGPASLRAGSAVAAWVLSVAVGVPVLRSVGGPP
jgi:hypothetical protein